MATAMCEAGAVAYLPKGLPAETLIAAILRAPVNSLDDTTM